MGQHGAKPGSDVDGEVKPLPGLGMLSTGRVRRWSSSYGIQKMSLLWLRAARSMNAVRKPRTPRGLKATTGVAGGAEAERTLGDWAITMDEPFHLSMALALPISLITHFHHFLSVYLWMPPLPGPAGNPRIALWASPWPVRRSSDHPCFCPRSESPDRASHRIGAAHARTCAHIRCVVLTPMGVRQALSLSLADA